MSAFSDVAVTMNGVLSVLFAIVAVMILIVLYHLLFIVSDLRKITRRFEETSAQVEAVVLKPLAMIDEALSWVIDFLQQPKKAKKHHAAKEKGEKPFDVEAI